MKIKRVKIVILIVVLSLGFDVFAQDEATTLKPIRPLGISIGPQFGFIYQHKPDMDHLVTGHIKGLNIHVYRNFNGDKKWQADFAHPAAGIHLQGIDLANPYLGHAIAVMPFINFPLNGFKNNPLRLKVSTGLGWLTAPFRLEENIKNTAISSHINAAIHFEIAHSFRISEAHQVGFGLSLTHYSNGAWSVPNTGVNIFALNANYAFHSGAAQERKTSRTSEWDNTFRILLWGGGSGKEIFPVNRASYPAATLALSGYKRFSPKSSIGTGLDFMYDGTLANRNHSLEQNPSFSQNVRVGTGLRYVLHFNRIRIPLEQLFYLWSKNNPDTFLYQRIGIQYEINKKLIAGVTLKSHFAKADYVEWQIGYLLK